MLGETPDTPVSPPVPAPRATPGPWDWLRDGGPALLQIIAVSGFPTQLIIAAVLIIGVGMAPTTESGLSLQFVATLSFLDTALVALMMLVFLRINGEDTHSVFLGDRPVWPEIWRGLALVPVVFFGVSGLVALLRWLVPALQTVPDNPLAAFMSNPFDAAIFAVVVVLAGGVREELQRAFILHRFQQRLGGAWLGNVLFGLLFGALHIDQGVDVAIVIGLMGMAWGAMFIRRRSVVAGMVNHAGFNMGMVIQQVLAKSLGLAP
jgi:membrane protease YdiL (CAAX protease family)